MAGAARAGADALVATATVLAPALRPVSLGANVAHGFVLANAQLAVLR